MSTEVKSGLPTLNFDRISYHYSTRWWETLRWGRYRSTGPTPRPESKSRSGITPAGISRGIYDLSLSLTGGCVTGITGPNGAGKSTLFKIVCGDLYAQSGGLYLNGVDVTRAPRWQRARLGLAYLSQRGALVGDLSVALNLELGAEAGRRWGSAHSGDQAEEQTLGRDMIIRALERFDVSRLSDQRVETLSGGERRRVELARLSLTAPRFALLDEPFAALDAEGIALTLMLIKQMRAQGVLVLLTDHQSDYISEVCDQVCCLRDGQLIDQAGDVIEGRER